MKKIDIRFNQEEINLLSNCIDRKFEKYKSDPFQFTNTIYNRIALFIGGKVYQIRNEVELQDYFGIDEDVAKFIFETINKDDVKSGLEDTEQIDTMINSKITNIYLIQEKQKLFDNKTNTYEVDLTRAIVFKTKDREYAFVKDAWFSEEIEIIRGVDLVSKLTTDYEKENNDFGNNKELYIERFVEEI